MVRGLLHLGPVGGGHGALYHQTRKLLLTKDLVEGSSVNGIHSCICTYLTSSFKCNQIQRSQEKQMGLFRQPRATPKENEGNKIKQLFAATVLGSSAYDICTLQIGPVVPPEGGQDKHPPAHPGTSFRPC